MSKITSDIWNEILSRTDNGEMVADIAKEFSICESTIYKRIRERNQSCIDISSYVEVEIDSNEYISFKLNNYSFQVLKNNLKEFLSALND